MLRLFLIALFLSFSFPAQAQDRTYFNVCIALDESVTNENPAYVPGVDVNGNPVTPADLNEPLKAVNYPLSIPIEVDLIRLINLNVPNGIVLDPKVAEIKIFEDGHAEYNGQDISSYVNYSCNPGLIEATEDETVTAAPLVEEEPKTKVVKEVAPAKRRNQKTKNTSDNGQAVRDVLPSSAEPEGEIIEGSSD